MTRSPKRIVVTNPADGGFFYWVFKLYLFGGMSLAAIVVASLPVIYIVVVATTPVDLQMTDYRQQAELETQIRTPDGQLLTALADKRRYLVEVDDVPQSLIQAFMAIEDRAFYDHGGVDFKGLLRAAWANLKAGGVQQGGSTITQQVAKSYLSPERTIRRKLRELVMARRLETHYTKKQILFLYLNRIYLGNHSGNHAYGVAAAALVHFGKSLNELTLAETALLAGLARAPSRYSPHRNPKRAGRRRNRVLEAMHQAGFIDEQTKTKTQAETLDLAEPMLKGEMLWTAPHFTEHVRRLLVQRFCPSTAPYCAEGRNTLYGAGWQVSTTIDIPLQHLARSQAWKTVSALDKRQGWRGPLINFRTPKQRQEILGRIESLYDTKAISSDRPYPALIESVQGQRAWGRIGQRKVEIPISLMLWAAPYSRTKPENNQSITSAREALHEGDLVWTKAPAQWLRRKGWGEDPSVPLKMALDQIPRVEAVVYTYDHNNGDVLAMIGGLDYDRSTFNRATQACRQPGSTYKPIYYSLALDQDTFSMGTILRDKPYEPAEGEAWNPKNVHGTLDGKVTMHFSLVRSLNLPSIQLLNTLGADNVEVWARRLGFTTKIHADKALALGASCVRTDELTRAFATFARGGTQQDPHYIRQIRDRNGSVVADYTQAEDPWLDESDRLDRVWATSEQKAKRVIDAKTAFLISKLLRDSVTMGIAGRCRIVPVPTAGKGGTSSDTMDVWFVGFTSQWTTTAWVGDDNYSRMLGAEEASYTAAIPLWAKFMKAAVRDRPHQKLPTDQPEGLRSATIDFHTGGKPTAESKTVQIFYRPGSFTPP